MQQILRIILPVMLFTGALLTAAPPPIKVKELKIPNEELLSYGVFISGERYQDLKIVSQVSEDKKTIKVYTGKYTIGSDYPMPAHYSKYQRQFTVDLVKGTLISGFGDYEEECIKENRTGEVYFDIKIDSLKNTAFYSSKIWDGYEFRMKKIRVKTVPGYSAWDMPSIVFVGARLLDLSSEGIIYVIYPDVVKEAVPGSIKVLGKEKVTVPAGTFNTIKIGVSVNDPFLANLLERYTSEMNLWIEDSPRGLVVKTHSPYDDYQLEKIGTW